MASTVVMYSNNLQSQLSSRDHAPTMAAEDEEPLRSDPCPSGCRKTLGPEPSGVAGLPASWGPSRAVPGRGATRRLALEPPLSRSDLSSCTRSGNEGMAARSARSLFLAEGLRPSPLPLGRGAPALG
eukprot:CAMPEP_0175978216 /NCGR_PEP_ID=MMETSP0108-20121206/45521_1 /TAXON_ID=195067 ORGANISM="Goniomonas pacifica, Strain CCMP1869" /NCGR_SAMPLE_ID=MMETSP0108 /ASSEMBLY_ACC=CAM_ASM_000204 /LENGTH=126 /DNA_ID=CAMNT_0017308339 /DNA_START=8 /DNA_END=389 /DNA_ORIENTATION=+